MFHFAFPAQTALRQAITDAYRRNEIEAVQDMLQRAQMSDEERNAASELARRLVTQVRAGRTKAGGVDALMHEFSLSSEEGIALMCLAEALLRIPDNATRDRLIADKISDGNWKSHLNNSPSLFVNAAAWGLLITGKLTATNDKQMSSALSRLISKGGAPLIRQGVNYAMRLLGKQFVTGQTIEEALQNGKEREKMGYRFSFDMLGEAAYTQADADRYYRDYVEAIHAIGKDAAGQGVYEGNGISVKLSAIHPRYSRAQHGRVMGELLPRLKELFLLGKKYDIGINIDAEEANRLELSLDLMEALVSDPDLAGYKGIGFVVQAYQKRCPFVIDYLIDLARRNNQKLMIRLVKGAYWDSEIKWAQDVVDMGPGAGEHGGNVLIADTPENVARCENSVTGQYLSGKKSIAVPSERTPVNPERMLVLKGARGNNLKNVTLELPLGLITCITGVSGSGKSTLINDTLAKITARELNRAQEEPAPYDDIRGLEHLDKVINVNQSPIGRTPRSNPATYTGLFTPIRELFAGVPLSRERGYNVGRFSFNVKGGRCEACQGDGVIKVEMHFLPDVYVPCEVCHGKRYNRETLEIQYKGKNISQVLDMTVEEAREFFDAVPTVSRKLQTLMDVGLGYIRLGQSATTLSGGEAQRVKLALELSKRDTGRTLYILDEPTTGLHFADIALLLEVIGRLKGKGNSIVIIEHNLDVIKTADWIVDLGPEGGDGGGRIIACGSPEQVAEVKGSYTGKYLKVVL
ncbi:proline dehydrogenase family protein [Neisseria meningitidis]|nr:proline dehydrogenase family protein [Neisseria meningitidis]